jgi:hypothetical protein
MSSTFNKIVFLLDKSGSMALTKLETVRMVNSYIKEQSEVSGEIEFSLGMFNTEMEIVIDSKTFGDFDLLKNSQYNPEGETALFDSIIKFMDMHAMKRNIIFVILTDGEDNKSNITMSELNSRIENAERELDWKFIYLCATNVSFKKEDPRYISFDPSSEGILTLSRSVSRMTDDIRNRSSTVNTTTSTHESSSDETFENIDPNDFSYLTPKSPKTPTKPLRLLPCKRKFSSISS